MDTPRLPDDDQKRFTAKLVGERGKAFLEITEDRRSQLERLRERLRAQREEEMAARERDLKARCLPKEKLKHGAYYRGECRANTVARWNAERNCFFVWNFSCGGWWIETIYHPDDDSVYDIFAPFEEISVPEKEIPFEEP